MLLETTRRRSWSLSSGAPGVDAGLGGIDVLVTDMVTPHLPGPDLLERARDLRVPSIAIHDVAARPTSRSRRCQERDTWRPLSASRARHASRRQVPVRPNSSACGVDTALGGNVQSTDTRTVLQREVADVHVEHTTTDDNRPRAGENEGRILATQNKILELIAKRSSFQKILDSLCLLVEQQSEGATCSILLVDRDRRRLRIGAGPSVSPEYMAALDGLSIAENTGSCGSAAFQREPVICADVEHDPQWANFREVAARLGIKSCWSTPFFSSTDQVLGTFAISHSYPCAPDPFDCQLLQTSSYLAGIATENQLFETEMIKDQKLESVGVLAGGIAHDFNNLLTAIMGSIELAMARVTPGDEVHRLLSAAATASVRAREITRQLLTFASGGVPVTSAESISDVIRETADFTLVGSNVRYEARFETGPACRDRPRTGQPGHTEHPGQCGTGDANRRCNQGPGADREWPRAWRRAGAIGEACASVHCRSWHRHPPGPPAEDFRSLFLDQR